MIRCEDLEEHWLELLEDRSDSPQLARLTAHVNSCAACRARLQAEREILDAYRALPDLEAPAKFDLDAALGAKREPRRSKAWTLAAALLIVGLATFAWFARTWFQGPSPDLLAHRFLEVRVPQGFESATEVREAFAPHLESKLSDELTLRLRRACAREFILTENAAEAVRTLRESPIDLDAGSEWVDLGKELAASGYLLQADRVLDIANAEFADRTTEIEALRDAVQEGMRESLRALGYLQGLGY